ncbi:MAG: hypothetical protein Q4D16_15360 [Eubacteriales bacterium]|nr:hypothetical protein [Eubacteriales bacterium]
MIDFEYAKCIAELLTDETLTEDIFCLRMQAIQRLRAITAQFEKEGFLEELVEQVFKKKAAFLMEATSKTQIEKIMKPSTPHYSCGNFYPGSCYHVEEEELLIWSRTSMLGPMIPSAQKRFEELFEKYCCKEDTDLAA